MRASPPPGNVVFSHCVPSYTRACPVVGVAITTSVRESSVLAPPEMVTSPLPRSELPFTVLMLVQDTRTA